MQFSLDKRLLHVPFQHAQRLGHKLEEIGRSKSIWGAPGRQFDGDFWVLIGDRDLFDFEIDECIVQQFSVTQRETL